MFVSIATAVINLMFCVFFDSSVLNQKDSMCQNATEHKHSNVMGNSYVNEYHRQFAFLCDKHIFEILVCFAYYL